MREQYSPRLIYRFHATPKSILAYFFTEVKYTEPQKYILKRSRIDNSGKEPSWYTPASSSQILLQHHGSQQGAAGVRITVFMNGKELRP